MDIFPCGVPQHATDFRDTLQNPMSLLQMKSRPVKAKAAFTLVEMLVVIAIISILMTAGSIGLSSIGGKGVTSGVANAEALFNEARSTAVGKNIRACVLVAKKLSNNSADDLRRIIVATEPVDANGKPTTATGTPVTNWVLSSRGAVLPDQTFFSSKFSKKDHAGAGGSINTVTLSSVKTAYRGDYYVYEFNSQGILIDPSNPTYKGGASFVIGTGARTLAKAADTNPPRVSSSAKRDFGGFVIWRNGGTSVFRSPEQISIGALSSGDTF
jgi:prepilin-type N-terminal cleavage/methylation domain-containing protein